MLETKRLNIDLMSNLDIPRIMEFYQENAKYFSPWDPPIIEEMDELAWKAYLLKAKQDFENKTSFRFFYEMKDSKELAGFCSFTSFEKGPFYNCRLGYKQSEKFEGQGFMTEALKECIHYLFTQENVHRIEANYIPYNTRSGNVLKNLGFEEHGLAKNYLYIDGGWKDHILTSKINSNWKNIF